MFEAKSTNTKTFSAAVDRAQSRAAVLQSLQNAYNSNKGSKSAKDKSGAKAVIQNGAGSTNIESTASINPGNKSQISTRQPTGIGGYKNNTETAVHALQQAFGQSAGVTNGNKYEKTRKFFYDQLQNKSIVLENSTQADAAKFSNRAKIEKKRKVLVSNKKLKKLKVCDPLIFPTNEAVRLLHDSWWSYIKDVVDNCQSEAQLQARLMSCEMVGARIGVVDALGSAASSKGTWGIVTAVSKNCCFIAEDAHAPVESGFNTSSGSTYSSCSGGSSSTSSSGVFSDCNTDYTSSTTTDGSTVKADERSVKPLRIYEKQKRQRKIRTVVKEHCVLAVCLPVSSSSSKRRHRSTPTLTSTSAVGFEGGEVETGLPHHCDKNMGDGGSGRSDGGGSSSSNSCSIASAWDHNERSEGGRRYCLLYGKSFMPFCTYS